MKNVLLGLFFDKNEILPSEGHIKVVYDGNSNNYVLADSKLKVIADLGIGLKKEDKFIIGDKNEFAKLSPISIREDKFTGVFANSGISACLPTGITLNTNSLQLYSGETLLDYNDYDMNDNCIYLDSVSNDK